MLRIPNPVEFAELPYAERLRITRALRDLLRQYAYTEVEDEFAGRQRVLREARRV